MIYKILKMKEGELIFETRYEGLDLEVRVNCSKDENHEDGRKFDTVMVSCPSIPISEITVQRFVRDLNVMGIPVFRHYEKKYR